MNRGAGGVGSKGAVGDSKRGATLFGDAGTTDFSR